MSDIVLRDRAEALALLQQIADAQELRVVSVRTRQLYARDWAHFAGWCAEAGLSALPATPLTVRLYLADLSMQVDQDGAYVIAPPTMARRLAAIARQHKEARHESPTRDPGVLGQLGGIRRDRKHRPRQDRALMLAEVRTILAKVEPDLIGLRDRFAILLGFVGAFRRAEVAGLDYGSLTWHPGDGLHVRLWESKTNQAGAVELVPLPFGRVARECVVCAWVRWTGAARDGTLPGPVAGWSHVCRRPPARVDPAEPLLRGVRRGGHLGTRVTGDALHAMVKRRAAAVGLEDGIGFHSLRAGFVTQTRRNGATVRQVKRQTRQRADSTVELYDRENSPLVDNAVTLLGI